ncbi:MAG: efflux RND transporter periplasmic adaptor subunit [Saprospiraceae bacterium]|nr:efflux RND transporter periplasmic adaptor subunit [Saprospiraceae bacterium]
MKKLFLLFIIASFFASCGGNSDATTETENPAEIKPDTPVVVREIVGIARIEPPEKIITLNAESGGYVREVRFQENQLVKKGDILIVLDGEVEQAQLQQARSKVQSQKDAITAAKATLESLKVKLANARNTYDRNQRLAKGNAATQQQVDDSRFNVEDIEKQIVAQQASIAEQQSRSKEIEADIEYYQTLSARRVIRAPLTGIFLSSNIKPGTYISTETALGEFAMEGPYQAITEVDELFANKVQIGQNAYIRPQGSSEQLATGKVVYVAPFLSKKSLFSDSPDNLEDRRVREARVQLNANDKVLIGSRVECVILMNN